MYVLAVIMLLLMQLTYFLTELCSDEASASAEVETFTHEDIKEKKIEEVNANLHCSVCKANLNEPVTLQCLHSICRKCLTQVLGSNVTADTVLDVNVTPLICQDCGYSTSLEYNLKKTEAVEHIAQYLTPPQVILTLLDCYEEKQQIVCISCKNQGKTITPTFWCFDCIVYLCEECVLFHSSLPVLKKHKIYRRDEMTGVPFLFSKAREICDKHGLRLKRLCEENQCTCCDTCIATEHTNACSSQHEIMSDVSHLVDPKLSALKTSVRAVIHELNLQIEETCQIESNTGEIYLGYTTLINESYSNARKNILEKMDLLLAELCKAVDSNLEDMKLKTNALQQRKSVLQNALTIVSISCSGSEIHSFLEKKKVRKTISEVQEATRDLKQVPIQDFSPVFKGSLQNMCTLKEFGHVRKLQPAMKVRSFPFGSYMFSLVTTIDVATGYSHVTGCDWLSENELIIVDGSRNPEVRIYSMKDGSLNRKASLESKPFDIAVVSRQKCVITFPKEKKIMAYNPLDLSKIENIDVSFSCFGIYHLNFGMTIVVGGKNMVLYNREFEVSKLVDVPGENIRYVCPHSNNLVFYSELQANNVHSVVGNGDERFKYHNSDMKGAAGLLLDENKNIYVCEKGSKYIHVLNKRGIFIDKFDVGETPTTLSISPNKSRICIIRAGHKTKNVADIYIAT